MKKGKKCPNCGYVSSENLDFCPKCDQFETRIIQPLTDENFAEKTSERVEHEKLALKQETPNESPMDNSFANHFTSNEEATVGDEVGNETKEFVIERFESPQVAAARKILAQAELKAKGEEKQPEPEVKKPIFEPKKPKIEIKKPMLEPKEQAAPKVEPKVESAVAKMEQAVTPVVPKVEAQEPITPVEVPKVAPVKPKEQKATPAVETKKATSSTKKAVAKAPRKKKNYGRVLGILAVLLLACGGGYYYLQQSNQAKKAAEVSANLEKEVARLSIEADKLYLNDEHIFLSESFSVKDLKALEDKVNSLSHEAETTELRAMMTDLKARATKQFIINELFQTPLVIGDKLDESAVIKSPQVKVPAEINPEVDAFDELISKGRREVMNQLEAIKEADSLVSGLFSNNKVDRAANSKKLAAARASLDKLKDPTLKASLDEKLGKVSAELTKITEQAAKAKAGTVQVAQAPVYQTPISQAPVVYNQGSTTPSFKNNASLTDANNTPYNAGQGVTTQANKDTIQYVNVPEEGPWAWAPGVKEKVLAETIRRGYVVEGGYILKQKEVINGESYYDLYATNLESSLLKGRSPEELPIYIVTINAKTGWYKGEGPN